MVRKSKKTQIFANFSFGISVDFSFMKHLFVEVPKGNLVPLQINVSEQKKEKLIMIKD